MKEKKRRYYALPCMIAIAITAALVAGSGFVLRGTLLKGLPQYDGVPDIAIPMMLLQDMGPLREARARAEWGASGHEAVPPLAPSDEPMPVAVPVEITTAEPAMSKGPTIEPAMAAALAAEPADMPTVEPPITAVPTEAPPVETPILKAPTATPAEMPTVEPPITAVPTEAPPVETPIRKAPTSTPADRPTAAAVAARRMLMAKAPDEAPVIEPAPEPVPAEITESFFDHTLFIGDSKTDGMRMWGRLGEAEYFCGTSYSVFNLFSRKTSDVHFKEATLEEVLSSREYNQIYILLGYNECGYPYESLMDQYRYVVSRVHEAQPKAKIILHGIMHASARVAKKHSYYTVAHIEMMNDGLRQIAAETEGFYYVDCNEAFCDADGYLLSRVSSDGEHLTPEYTAQWAQEILKRAVVD